MDTGQFRWLSPSEAAVYCRVGKTRLYSLMKSGALRPRKLGRKTLIAREELDALIESGSAPTTKAGTP